MKQTDKLLWCTNCYHPQPTVCLQYGRSKSCQWFSL